MAKLTNSTLKSLLASEKADALAGMGASKLTDERARALEYYNGDVSRDMPSLPGRSTAVSSDVLDTVEGLMPSLLEIFCGGDEVVKFDAVGPEDVEAAQQESDYVNHVFMQQNPGFLILYTFIKDALLSKTGIVKVWSEEYTEEKKETYLDQTPEAFMMLAANPEVEIIEHSERVGEAGLPVHDVTVMTRKDTVKHCVENVPPEEFGISRNAKSVQKAGYCFHEVAKSEADAIACGFDEKQIKALPTYVDTTKTETLSRDTVEESTDIADEGANTANRMVKITEHYVVMDYEQNGKPKLYRVTTGGDQGEVLKRNGKNDIEEVDCIPFAAMTPIIMPHRFFGKSVADLVMDIMRIKTALYRALLDNAYLANNPRTEIAETFAGANTLDDLLTSRVGGIVRTKQPGGLNVLAVPSIGNHVLPLIEYVDATREWRTGVTRQGQGIDANALQNQSATAVNQAFTAAQARMKLIARIFAETGIRDLFSLLHATIRKHGSQAATVRLRNKWIQIDPRQWKDRNDMTINVGLGSGSKADQIAETNILIQAQEKAIGVGLVSPQNLYNTAKRLTRLLGEKDPDMFFTPPGQQGDPNNPASAPIQPQPDPKVQQIQMQAQLDEKADQRKAEIERIQAEADIATEQRKLEGEMVIKQQDFALKKELALIQAALEREKFEREEARKDREHQQRMEQDRVAHEQAMQSGVFKAVAAQETHRQKMEQANSKGAD